MSPPRDFNAAGDQAIGAVLCLCSVLGVVLNIAFLCYFLSKPALTSNSRYFARAYVLVAAVDLLIALSLIPYIDAAFSTKRQGKLFTWSKSGAESGRGPLSSPTESRVCEIWAVLSKILLEMAVCLVAFISVSRLALLCSPTRMFSPVLAWVLPLVYGIGNTLFKMVLLLTGTARVFYLSGVMTCEMIVQLTEEEGEPIKAEEWRWELTLRALACIQSGMTAIPISLSCLISVIYLLNAERKADKVRSKKTRQIGKMGVSKQREATLSVIIFTLIYIILHVPTLLYYVNLVRWSVSIIPGEMTKAELRRSHGTHFRSDFEKHYMWVVFVIVFTAINSAVNPVFYFFRMRGFREFVRVKMSEKSGSIRQSLDLIFSNHDRGIEDLNVTEDKDFETTV